MTAAIQRQMRGIQRRADDQSYQLNGELIFPKSGSSMDFSQFCFGFSVNGATVTVIGGDWHIGSLVPLELESTDIPISQDGQYVGIEVDTLAKTIKAIGPATDKTVFNSDPPKFRTWLHQFNFSNGSVSLARTKLGSLFMPGTFGALP